VNNLDYKGITTTIKFQADGDLQTNVQTVNLYEDEKGNIVELGNILNQK
jgi:branched-chain amino acid transport system substrate-binding protein